MSARETVTFYLHPKLRRQSERGQHNFIGKLSDVLTAAGLSVAYDNDDDVARLRALTRSGRSLFLMDSPVNTRGLTFRKTYLYPFWHIEKQSERWDWPVAQAAFDADAHDTRKAANFHRFWRQRTFGESPREARKDGFVFVPLQGQLLRQRSFQTCSPVDMIKAVLAHDAKRQVVITLHPSENYSVAEQSAVEDLIDTHDRLFLQTGDTALYLQNCDYIVTQNSSMGFMGYFYNKPLILFGKVDFHHIALNVSNLGERGAFDAIENHTPDYAAYLFWFLQQRSINAGRPEVMQKTQETLRGHDWPV